MDLREMNPMDRSRAVEEDLWTLQAVLEEAYTRVGGTPDPANHRRELTRLEAICAVLRATSQMSGSKSINRVLCSLVIALRQMQTAASIGLVGMRVPLAQGELVWLSPSDMKESIECSPDTHWIGSVEGWIRLAAFIRARRKGLLQDAKMATLFRWTKAYESDALEDASLKPISAELIDDPYELPAAGQGPSTAANLKRFGRLLRDITTAVRTRTEADFRDWASEVWNGAELVKWMRGHSVPGTLTVETPMEAATIALDVLTTRYEQGFRWMEFRRKETDVRFVAVPSFGIIPPAGAVWIGHFDVFYRLSELVLLQLRLGNGGARIRKALLSDDGRKLLEKGNLLSRILSAKQSQKRA